jgi:hypothetical protein
MLIAILLVAILPIRSATKRALLIGISEYPTNKTVKEATWPVIHGANDVQIIGKTLKSQGFRVSTLTNANATASKIRKALAKLQSEANAGDIIYLHFSCHGQPVEDQNGDEKDGWDEAIVPYDAWKSPIVGVYDGSNHILDDELNAAIGKIRDKIGIKGFIYVVIDACHAGSSYRGDAVEGSVFVRGTDIGFSKSGKNYAPRIDKRGNFRIKKEVGVSPIYMLEACRSYEVNTEIKQDGIYYGPITYFISLQLLTQPLSHDINWIENVRRNMDMDVRLIRQHMVVESSE